MIALVETTGGGLPEPVPGTVSVKGRLKIAVTSAVLVGLNTRSKVKLSPGLRVKGGVPASVAVNALDPYTLGIAGMLILPLPA